MLESRPLVYCRSGGVDCDDLDQLQSRAWLRIAVAAIFSGQVMVFSLALSMTPPPFGSTVYWVLHGGLIFASLIVILFLGGPLFESTLGMLRSRRLSIEGLFTLSLMGAFVGSLVSSLTGQGAVYYEVVSIVIAIYTVGRILSERSQVKLRTETDAMRASYDQALKVVDSGEVSEVLVRDLEVGDRVRIDPGAAFTIDGIVRNGTGFVRETALTGEPQAVVRRVGDTVRAGTWSEDGSFVVEVVSGWGQRELDQILKTVEDGSGRVSEMQTQANRMMQFFLPLVVGVSVLTAVVWAFVGTWVDVVLNSMSVLLVACPCALGLATPVAIWNGLVRLSKLGLVSRDGALIDALAQTRTLFFDKTGTLSEERLQIREQWVADCWQERRELLFGLVRAVESRFSHPLAQSLLEGLPETEVTVSVSEWSLLPGQGVRAECMAEDTMHSVLIGSRALATESAPINIAFKLSEGTTVFVWVNNELAAAFVLEERLRAGTESLWTNLESLGVEVAVLTGDPDPQVALPEQISISVGMSATAKQKRIAEARETGAYPIFVGDGVNDSPGMSYASASIAMGSGASLTQATASGRLSRNDLSILPEAIKLSRGIYHRLRGNLLYAVTYNLIGMSIAACGILHPVVAALIMLVSSFFVTTRSLGK